MPSVSPEPGRMSGPEHYRAAEQLLEQGRSIEDWEGLVAAAQVHATLALAAATAIPRAGDMPVPDCDDWWDVAGTRASDAPQDGAA